MRIAVLTGLFACTLVFVGSTQTASASEADLLPVTPQANDSTALKLIAVADTTQSDLLPVEGAQAVEIEAEEPLPTTHTIKENETLSDIAKLYDTTWQRLYDKNTSIDNPDVVEVGTELDIPSPDEELESRELPVIEPSPVVAPATPASSSAQNANATVVRASAPAPRGSSSGNLYAAGNCTWHVKSLRPDLPNNLGNANTWAARAAAQGIPTGSTPRVGAAAQFKGRMHVAYVTAVNGDGTVTISEMNYRNLYEVTSRVVPASALTYIY